MVEMVGLCRPGYRGVVSQPREVLVSLLPLQEEPPWEC